MEKMTILNHLNLTETGMGRYRFKPYIFDKYKFVDYLVAVGHRMFPRFLIFPTRTETRGTYKHLASIPTSDASKCWSQIGSN